MRVTNNMIINKANTNINNNKIAVDKGNTQMTTQKKIDRPSEDPVIAVRSLRLQTALGKIEQYYERNIPDADAWMDITETALLNINENMKEFRTLCVNGATGTLTQDDRKTILQQLTSLQESIFAQGNADYAGRTVFTGYRTNKDLVFTKHENDTNYNITDRLSADKMEKVRYYNGEVTVPTSKDQIEDLKTGDTAVPGTVDKSEFTSVKSEYNRLRLGYDDITMPANIEFSYTNPSSGEVKGFSIPLCQSTWNTLDYATGTDHGTPEETHHDNIAYTINADGVKTFTVNNSHYGISDPSGDVTYNVYPDGKVTTGALDTAAEKEYYGVLPDNNVNDVVPVGNTIIKRTLDLDDRRGLSAEQTYTDALGVVSNYKFQEIDTDTGGDEYTPEKVYIFDSEDDWAMWSSAQAGYDGSKMVPDKSMVLIKSTGDLIFGNDVASKMQSAHMNVDVNYDKTGFNSGDLRPEFYYDSVDWSDNQNRVVYEREDNNYDINYTIAQNLDLTVNLQAWDIFNGDVQQDMKDMTACVTRAIDASDKLTKIENLLKDPAYQSETDQNKLKEWQKLAQREFDFANDDMDKLFSSVLGKSDEYYDKINLAITKLGCMKDQLLMTERRMDEQQQTVTDLQSKNDNLDLSQIVINYTASYTAYQSSLQAAGKLGQQTLLNYI